MDVRAVAREVFAEACLRAFVESCAGFASPAIGLPTGRTPVPFYEALREAAEAGRVQLAPFRPFAIDEYGGPRDHPCSNRAFFRRYWDAIPGAPEVAQFDAGAADPQAEVKRFAGRLAASGGLDVVVLGVGLNGHLAFNEPGASPDATAAWVLLTPQTRASASSCWGKETPAHGMTLGLAELLGARSPILLASGATKAAIVARALAGPVGPECPASFLQKHPAVVAVLDDDAAAQLPPGMVLRRS